MPPAAAGVSTGRAPSHPGSHQPPHRRRRPGLAALRGAIIGLAPALALVPGATVPASAQPVAAVADLRSSTLTLVTVVTNDNGGSASPSAWTLKAVGPTRLSGPSGTTKAVPAGSYNLSKAGGVPGYTASAWSCSEGQADDDTVTVAEGRDVTCTISYDDQPGRIVVSNVTDPPDAGTWSFTATGPGYASFTLTGGASNSQALDAGIYTVTEGPGSGWLLTGLGGSGDPLTPYACTAIGGGGSFGRADLSSRAAIVTLRPGDTVTCVFENTRQSPGGATRTEGFWSTHPALAEVVWSGGVYAGTWFGGVDTAPGIADKEVCGRSIDTQRELQGGFWARPDRTSARARRTDLDQARMELLAQVLAAELNTAAFGSVPAGGSGVFDQWEQALCGADVNAIRSAEAQAAAFNGAGDSAALTPGVMADPRRAQRLASVPFWDTTTGP